MGTGAGVRMKKMNSFTLWVYKIFVKQDDRELFSSEWV